jgi:large subunit ribosomal protein L32e
MTIAGEKAIALRERVKKRKPSFVRQESWRYVRLKENWRRPRGLDNKMRLKVKGWPPTVNAGYRGPKIARGLHPSGFREILVYNVQELKAVNPKTHAVRIAHTVSKRKRMEILTEAKRKGITILNVREIKEKIGEKKEEAVKEEQKEKETEKEEEEAGKVKQKEAKSKRRKREQ